MEYGDIGLIDIDHWPIFVCDTKHTFIDSVRKRQNCVYKKENKAVIG